MFCTFGVFLDTTSCCCTIMYEINNNIIIIIIYSRGTVIAHEVERSSVLWVAFDRTIQRIATSDRV